MEIPKVHNKFHVVYYCPFCQSNYISLFHLCCRFETVIDFIPYVYAEKNESKFYDQNKINQIKKKDL